jgi:hypothetical protein
MLVFSKIPELMQGILENLAKQKPSPSKFREEAKQKLISDLKNIMGDMGNLSKLEDEKIIEEQIKQIMEFPKQSEELVSLIQKMQSKVPKE